MTFSDFLLLFKPDDRWPVEERAAIHQFEGGATRAEAERLTMEEFSATPNER